MICSGRIEENIKKARQAFFSYGSIGAFRGELNPLSSRSIIDSCVMPVLTLCYLMPMLFVYTDYQKTVRRIDKEKLVLKCHKKSPTIANVTSSSESWSKLWDTVLHLGSRYTSSLRNLSRLMTHHGRGRNPCPLCDEKDLEMSVVDHTSYVHHQELGLNFNFSDQLLTQLVEEDIHFVYSGKFLDFLEPFTLCILVIFSCICLYTRNIFLVPFISFIVFFFFFSIAFCFFYYTNFFNYNYYCIP